MKFYKFNRNRSLSREQKYRIAQNKANYLVDRGKCRVLDSINTENRTWGALTKAWLAYVISKNKIELSQMEYYARVIQKLQYELGLPISSFPDLDIYPVEGDAYSQSNGISNPYDIEYISRKDMEEW